MDNAINNYKKAIATRPENGYEVPAQVAEWMTDDSIEILQHFGLNAPEVLNNYACAVEDALIEQVKKNAALWQELEAYRAAERGDINL